MSDFDLERAAASFYTNSPTNDAPPQPAQDKPTPAATEELSVAERLFGRPAAAARAGTNDDRPVTELTEEEVAARLFRGSPIHGDAQRETVAALAESGAFTPDEAAEVFDGYMPLAETLALNATESKAAAEVLIGAWKAEPSPQLVASWREDSMAHIRSTYGPDRTAEVLRAAQEYVAGIPELRDMLHGAIGDNPTIVRIIVERAMRARARGVR